MLLSMQEPAGHRGHLPERGGSFPKGPSNSMSNSSGAQTSNFTILGVPSSNYSIPLF